MVRIFLYALTVVLLAVSYPLAQEVQPETQQNKEAKPKRDPIVDTFTRIDQGDGEVDAVVIYGDPLYFTYKGILDDAKKKYDLDKFYVFIVTINSQKKEDLSSFKTESSIFIRTEEGLEYPAVPQWVPLAETPGKRSGVVRFSHLDSKGRKVLKDNAKSFEIVIKGLAGVPERTFKWYIPIEF